MPSNIKMDSQCFGTMYMHIHIQENNKNMGILKELKNIQFCNLKVLYIFGNDIESIEVLIRIKMPLLQ